MRGRAGPRPGGPRGLVRGRRRSGAAIAEDEDSIDFRLRYEDLASLTQAHIHFGQAGVNGGVMVFLCSNLGSASHRKARGAASRAVSSRPTSPEA